VEKHGNQLASIRVYLVGKILNGRATAQANNSGAVTSWNYCTTKAWR
jgi:hypothetical protein